MNKIEKKFTRCGFQHTQLERQGVVALYKRQRVGGSKSTVHYEVVRINEHKGYNAGSQYIAPAETYPGASLWGLQGWTYNDIHESELKFKRACKRFNVENNDIVHA